MSLSGESNSKGQDKIMLEVTNAEIRRQVWTICNSFNSIKQNAFVQTHLAFWCGYLDNSFSAYLIHVFRVELDLRHIVRQNFSLRMKEKMIYTKGRHY